MQWPMSFHIARVGIMIHEMITLTHHAHLVIELLRRLHHSWQYTLVSH
jgi:hypothetical protein